MTYQASRATKKGPFHAVRSLRALTPGPVYKAICGVTVSDHYSRWGTIFQRRCPRCAKATREEGRP